MKKNGMYIAEDGAKCWYLNGEYHREDGPALETASGDKCWYINGKLHREDGPAIEYADGSKCWCINDNFHRLDGPAIEYFDDSASWYLDGKLLGEDVEGFWVLWDRLTPEQQNNLNLHQWIAKYT